MYYKRDIIIFAILCFALGLYFGVFTGLTLAKQAVGEPQEIVKKCECKCNQ